MIPNLLLSISKAIVQQFITGYNLIWNFTDGANDTFGETAIASNPATYQFVQARHVGAGLTITSLRVTNT